MRLKHATQAPGLKKYACKVMPMSLEMMEFPDVSSISSIANTWSDFSNKTNVHHSSMTLIYSAQTKF